MSHPVTLIRGDGTGPELAAVTKDVLDATGVAFDWNEVEAGVDIMKTAGTPLPDARLQALSAFTRQLVEKRGWVSADDVQEFQGAGFTQAQVLEVILGVGMKTLSNFANHIADPPVDDAFAANAWKAPEGANAS